MLIVHHLGLSQSERIVWLCEELGINYTLMRYDRRKDNRLAPNDYKALHSMGIAPVIQDGDLVLGESAAICEYINTRHGGGRLAPAPDDATYSDYLFWFHWSNATYMATRMIAMGIALSGGNNAKASFVPDRIKRCEEMMEQRLGDAPFFAGPSLSLADIMMVYSLTTSRAFSGTAPTRPNTLAYLRRIAERPAYLRAMAKAEPGMPPMID